MEITKIALSFYLHPMAQYGVRELSKITQTDTKTVLKYLKELIKQKIVIRNHQKGKYPYYEANRISNLYRHEKSELIIKKILESGLIEFLEKHLSPKTIVLFGSVQKGTYHQESDVDIFVQTKYKNIDIYSFNKKLGHPIQLFFEENLSALSAGLLENIYNGLVLSGKLEVVKLVQI
ncbi:nucleotidyltransferase domain-containing protein [Candidatus Woesearchaeota archaeon]|nr:nucleotidyltransferase domain-containing protein [Candidatus Woesearchaeota archaeon]